MLLCGGFIAALLTIPACLAGKIVGGSPPWTPDGFSSGSTTPSYCSSLSEYYLGDMPNSSSFCSSVLGIKTTTTVIVRSVRLYERTWNVLARLISVRTSTCTTITVTVPTMQVHDQSTNCLSILTRSSRTKAVFLSGQPPTNNPRSIPMSKADLKAAARKGEHAYKGPQYDPLRRAEIMDACSCLRLPTPVSFATVVTNYRETETVRIICPGSRLGN